MIEWLPAPDDNEQIDQLGAARMQHDIAYEMLREIKNATQYRSIKRYAESIGADPTRMGRMLRGSIVMRMEDIVSAFRHLGVTTFYNEERIVDLTDQARRRSALASASSTGARNLT